MTLPLKMSYRRWNEHRLSTRRKGLKRDIWLENAGTWYCHRVSCCAPRTHCPKNKFTSEIKSYKTKGIWTCFEHQLSVRCHNYPNSNGFGAHLFAAITTGATILCVRHIYHRHFHMCGYECYSEPVTCRIMHIKDSTNQCLSSSCLTNHFKSS